MSSLECAICCSDNNGRITIYSKCGHYVCNRCDEQQIIELIEENILTGAELDLNMCTRCPFCREGTGSSVGFSMDRVTRLLVYMYGLNLFLMRCRSRGRDELDHVTNGVPYNRDYAQMLYLSFNRQWSWIKHSIDVLLADNLLHARSAQHAKYMPVMLRSDDPEGTCNYPFDIRVPEMKQEMLTDHSSLIKTGVDLLTIMNNLKELPTSHHVRIFKSSPKSPPIRTQEQKCSSSKIHNIEKTSHRHSSRSHKRYKRHQKSSDSYMKERRSHRH